MIVWIAALSCLLALIPAGLFLRNLSLYTRLPKARQFESPTACSVLIPARNEEENIGEALLAIQRSTGVDFEVIVLDDGSTDGTSKIVRELSSHDPRVRLETAEALPAGWCGKPFACHQLAALARYPILIFLDADVRVSTPESLSRLLQFMNESGAALVSGVPREKTESFMERLIIPLIHFILLGFLPLGRMRTNTDPRFAAACGQIIAVRREAYERAGGHAAIPCSFHDGIALARRFRANGFSTDLFDATDTFDCRMYRSAAEVWNGFSRNATEGLASPRLILPSTLFLMTGQVLPFVLLFFATTAMEWTFALAALALSYLPRVVGAVRFQQSPSSVLLHPLGILGLLAIQWYALIRSLRGAPARWRGRLYAPASCILLFTLILHGDAFAAPVEVLSNFELTDQEAKPRVYRFPKEKITVMTVADHKGSEQLTPWITRIHSRYGKTIDIDGVADVSMIPKPFHGMFRSAFRKQLTYSVMLDWGGSVVKQFDFDKGVANIYVIDRSGKILKKITGPVSDKAFLSLTREIDRAKKEGDANGAAKDTLNK